MINKRSVEAEREQVIAQALDTPEGRDSIAQAMVEPIRRALEYQAVGRKLLLVDQLPQGALARYEKDVRVTAHVISRRGGAPLSIVEGEEVIVPTFEIVSNPYVRLSEIYSRRYYIVDRAQIKAKEAIQKEEDLNIFNAVNAAVDAAHTTISTGGSLSIDALNAAFYTIEQHDLTVGKIVMHAARYADMRNLGKTVYDEATQKEILSSGLFGHLYTANIHVSSKCPSNTVYLLAPAEYVGAFPIRQDISVLPANDPQKLRVGWVIYEDVGVVIINSYAVAKITVTSGS